MIARGRSYWHLGRSYKQHPILERIPDQIDVGIVGAGVVGLSTAIHVKALMPSASVAVFERMFPGAGATGRSGGIVYVDDDYLPGSVEDFRYFKQFLRKYGLNDLLSFRPLDWQRIEDDYPAYLLNPQILAERLAHAAEAVGVQIFTGTRVSAIVESVRGAKLRIGEEEVSSGTGVVVTGILSIPEMSDATQIEYSTEHCAVVTVGDAMSIPWNFAKLENEENDEFFWGRYIAPNKFLFGIPHVLLQRDEHFGKSLRDICSSSVKMELTGVECCWSWAVDKIKHSPRWRVYKVSNTRCVWTAAGFFGQGLLGGVTAGRELAKKILS